MLKFLSIVMIAVAVASARAENEDPAQQRAKADDARQNEAKHLRNIHQITFAGSKNGEAYFAADGKSIVFQGVREAGNPFYQIYSMNLSDGALRRVSTGKGKTTCSFFHPKKPRLLFASTHLDPETEAKQKEEIEKLKTPRRYSWDFDPNFDIFESDLDGGNLVRLTDAKGYDAEASYSPDGTKIVFCSFRDGDGEIYIMDSDGKNQTRLTTEKGYDGGPFFSPDGKKIVWRHFEDDAQKTAEVWTMNIDGSEKKQVTSLKSISWAPWWHPSMKWIIFASNFEDPAFELYAIRPDGKDLTRLTFCDGFDGLPVLSPDGGTLMWTSNRSENKSQIFMADVVMPDGGFPVPDKGETETGIDNKAFVSRVQSVNDALAANNVDHHVGKLFMDAGVKPIGVFDQIDETSYVQGPSVAGWLPPSEGEDSIVVVAAPIPTDADSAVNVAALMELIDRKLKAKEPTGGLFVSVGYPDELPHSVATAERALKIVNKDKKPLRVAAFICLSGMGKAKTAEVSLVGTGNGAGWRELTETLAIRYPLLSFSVEDDPSGAQELKLKPAAEVPAISIGTPRVALRPLTDEDGAEVVLWRQEVAVAAAVDCALSLLNHKAAAKFQPYDAAAVKAAASAASRPYLGTIPEYKGDGTGVKLTGVRDGSPAQKAGLQAGDLIVQLGGKPIKTVEEYLQALESLKTGEETTVIIKRGADELTVKITPAAKH